MNYVNDMAQILRLQQVRVKTLTSYRSKDWRKQPIVECGEKLVQVPEEMTYPYYADVMKLTTDRRIFLRESVLDAFMKARDSLKRSTEMRLIVYDGWRSLEVQENLFWHYLKIFTIKGTNYEVMFSGVETVSDIKMLFDRLPLDA